MASSACDRAATAPEPARAAPVSRAVASVPGSSSGPPLEPPPVFGEVLDAVRCTRDEDCALTTRSGCCGAPYCTPVARARAWLDDLDEQCAVVECQAVPEGCLDEGSEGIQARVVCQRRDPEGKLVDTGYCAAL